MAYKHVIRAKTRNLLNITPSMCRQCTYKDGILKANVVNFYYAVLHVTDLFEIGNTYTVSWSIIHKKSLSQTASVVVYGKSKTDPDKTVFREYRSAITGNNYTFTINDEDFSSISFVELRFFRYNTITTDTESSILNIQVELGSTPTPYTPYNYLQSNKRMIKVSDVCQLLDKSKFPATKTENGITWTNNGDGTITTTGNASKSGAWLNIGNLPVILISSHKYLLCGCPSGGATNTYWLRFSPLIAGDPKDLGNGIIFTAQETTTCYPLLQITPGQGDNLVWKPQFFDLTEMFGAGHEPATVAEFRQRFPNEYYPYSPQCWLTSYKSAVVCKTKNLFDVNKITESKNLKNNKDGTITVSVYGGSGGLLKNLCPELKVGDVIKVYFQPLRWTATKPPLVMVVGDVVLDRNGNSRLTVTERSLNRPVYFYNNDYDERGLPGTTIIGNILITTDLTITNRNYNVRYTPYQHL